MTGGGLLGLVLLSMAWLFFLAGTALNWAELLRAFRHRKAALPPIPFLPGVVGSLAVFFSAKEMAWPWLWILLPLVAEMLGIAAARALRKRSKSP
jgi:hypothetical protein